ncbi:MAG: type II secretion system F family protein [Chloroflexota bacterium]|nr:type II secretion system F family protein [Chloroflexota bacterium]
MWYRYVACNARGQTATGVLEAVSEHDAEETLWRSHLTIIDLEEKRKPVSIQEALPTLYGVKRHDVIYFTRDLATLLNSGIGILPALNMLHGRTNKKIMKKVLYDVKRGVEGGSSFSEACAQHPEVFTPFFIRMAKVGEEVGNLEMMLRQVALQMEKEEMITRKVRGALMYPTFVLVIAGFAIFALLYFVIPAMEVLFSQIGGELPAITVIVLAAANFVQANVLYLLLGAIGIFLFVAVYRKTEGGKRLFGAMMLKLPIIGGIILIGAMTQMARNIAIMVRGGISLTECLDLIVETTDNYPIRKAMEKVRSMVHSGESLSKAVGRQKIFPPLFGQVVGVGEASGRLETNLDVLADFYESEADRAISKATGLLSPILVLGCGGLVGLIALAIYMPIYSLMGQLGG